MTDTLYQTLRNLSFEYRVQHIPNSSPKRFKNHSLDWQYITIHNSANKNTSAIDEWARLADPQNTSIYGFHTILDDVMGIESIPLDQNVWACGDGVEGEGNRTSIDIELCVRPHSDKIIENAAELCATLLHLKGFDSSRVRQHFHWNGKNCPRNLRAHNGSGWFRLIDLIDTKLNRLINGEPYDIIPVEYPAKTVNSMVYISVRSFFTAIGGVVSSWNINERSVTVLYEGKKIVFVDGSRRFIGNDRKLHPLGSAAEMINENGDFYVPMSSIVAYLNGTIITWNPQTLTVTVCIGSAKLIICVHDSCMHRYTI